MSLRAAISGLLLLEPAAAAAQGLSLEFPAFATPLAERATPGDSYFLPTAPFTDGPLTGITPEGTVRQQSWKLSGAGLTTLQILAPLRAQLQDTGFVTLFECEARACGGFDFRYRVDIMPEPDMHVNLGDFRYLAAQRTVGGTPEYVGLIVSRSANAGFVQLTRIGGPDDATGITASTKAQPPDIVVQPGTPVGEQLERNGYTTLDDLFFKIGSSELSDQPFASLAGLAGYLAARPERRVVLVGHTDSEGSLKANIALSRRRAVAVMDRLVKTLGVDPGQVSADGVGYLAPRASNLTTEGRTQNRRVEAILSSTE